MAGRIWGSGGPDSDFSKCGRDLIGPKGRYSRLNGSSIMGPNGRIAMTGSGTALLPHGGQVWHNGSSWFGPKGRYSLHGGVLFGPDGKSWRGVLEEDVIAIIDSDS